MEGRRIDRYQLLEEVGSGGMAVVYKGLDTTLDREVAVKILHPHLASREESRRRFSREAKAVARLRHPNIVEIFDFSGDEARDSFIVTEFVRGRTLRVFGDEVGFPLPELAVLAAAALAEALVHAHGSGVVHRDLKPENVMVRDDGVLKLMDFGIARMIGKDERMTMTGALVGSPLHMPPEVIEGKESGAPADVFALGTILYWMVTGEMAFAGNNTTQTLRRILEGDYVDPRIPVPACSDELAELIARCLRRDPAERYGSMEELRGALLGLLEPLGIERPGEELSRFFREPGPTAERLRARLVERLVADGEAALAGKRPARALALFNRVLALDEGNERVRLHLERMRRGRARRRRLAWLAGALGAGSLLAGGVWAISLLPASPPEPAPAAARPEPAPEPAAPLPPPEPAPAVPAPARAEGSGERPLPDRVRPQPNPAPEARPSQKVQLRWVPQGATLYVDGERMETVAPAWSGELVAGPHTIALAHPECCQPFEERIEVTGGAAPLRRSIALAPKSGWFRVDCEQQDAEVWFDGTFKGTVASVNERGGVPVAFSKDDAGRERYVKTVRVQVRPPRGRDDLLEAVAEVTVRSGQRATTPPLRLAERQP